MDLLNLLNENKNEKIFGKFRAVVKNVEDPEKLGRIKVECFEIYGDGLSPWAWPCFPYGGSLDNGIFFPVEINSGVWIEFEQGYISNPIWSGVWWTKPNNINEMPTEIQNNYSTNILSGTKLIKTKSGHKIEFNDKDGSRSILISDKSGNKINIDTENNKITINSIGDLIINATDNISINAGGNITTVAGGELHDYGSTIDHN